MILLSLDSSFFKLMLLFVHFFLLYLAILFLLLILMILTILKNTCIGVVWQAPRPDVKMLIIHQAMKCGNSHEFLYIILVLFNPFCFDFKVLYLAIPFSLFILMISSKHHASVLYCQC